MPLIRNVPTSGHSMRPAEAVLEFARWAGVDAGKARAFCASNGMQEPRAAGRFTVVTPEGAARVAERVAGDPSPAPAPVDVAAKAAEEKAAAEAAKAEAAAEAAKAEAAKAEAAKAAQAVEAAQAALEQARAGGDPEAIKSATEAFQAARAAAKA